MKQGMETELTETYKSLVENPTQYSFLKAEEDFKNAEIKLTNPKYINDAISDEKSILSKLKFLYLEHETRYKFLQHISENEKDISIDQAREITESTQESKNKLKLLKQQLNRQIADIEIVSKEVCDLYRKYQELADTRLIEEAEQLELEIEKLKDSEDDWETLDFLFQGSNNIKALEEEKTKLKMLENEIELANRKYIEKTKTVDDLTLELKELNELIQKNNNEHQVVNTELQKVGQWNIAMNQLFSNLSELQNPKVICTTKGNYKLEISQNAYVIFTCKGQIVEVVGIDEVELFKSNINRKKLDLESFIFELAKYISKPNI